MDGAVAALELLAPDVLQLGDGTLGLGEDWTQMGKIDKS